MITIAPYDSAWPGRYAEEAARIRQRLGELALRIEHVGSTSVPGLAAKPVIDIQVSVATLEPRDLYRTRLAALGYTHLALGEFDLVYPFFKRPADWPSTHHVHLCVVGSQQERDHLAFRDSLRLSPVAAAAYAALKRKLASEHDGLTQESRERYSLSKTEFVRSVLGRSAAEPQPAEPLKGEHRDDA
jgi:GrpB-like predicted nucleotidyltransferase (UPF0157 family)